MMKTAHIQPLSGIIRVFDDKKAYHQDDYEWCGTLRWIDDNTVELLGIIKPPTLSQVRAIKKTCIDMGIEKLIFQRLRNKTLTTKIKTK